MKISFDLDKEWESCKLFRTKEEYDADNYSSAGYDRWHAAPYMNKTYGGPCTRYSHGPSKFPCLQFTGFEYNDPNGPYIIPCMYIYDFEISEDDHE